MNKYNIAILNFFDNENIIYTEKAENEIEAMKDALINSFKSEDNKIFQILQREDIGNTIEEIKVYCFNIDICISSPIKIDCNVN